MTPSRNTGFSIRNSSSDHSITKPAVISRVSPLRPLRPSLIWAARLSAPIPIFCCIKWVRGWRTIVPSFRSVAASGAPLSGMVARLKVRVRLLRASMANSALPCGPLSIPCRAETVQRFPKDICSISFSSEPKDRTEYVTSGELVSEREDCMATPVYPQHLAEKLVLQCVAGERHWV